MTTKTMLHASRAVSDVISSCVTAGVRRGHAGIELAALKAALITVSSYVPYLKNAETPGQYYRQRRQDSRFILKAFLFQRGWCLAFYLCYILFINSNSNIILCRDRQL